ncbi:MAG: HAD family hydrolase [Syntrophorhabdaceae bacterium]|nr:HAD family hydrolase [Syntrophorhabdaceae bacterium]
MKRIIVDIDNTLWHFAPVLYERMRILNPYVLEPSKWYDFNFWRPYLNPKDFFEIINSIHTDQEIFTPYPDARLFLSSLKDMGYHITIASHREKDTLNPTMNWLNKHHLIYDDIHLSYDKSVLFDKCTSVIDDSPIILDKAARSGIKGYGLKMPWNENRDYQVFDTLTDILYYLKA